MLDIGWTELLVIGALALIVVGPRDLPQLLRTVGQTVGKVKRMAREFQRSVEDAARETDVANFKELRDIKKDMGSFDFRQQAAKAQSYMNQPVKPDGEPAKTEAGKAAAAAAASAAAGSAADERTEAGPAAPVESDERQPAGTVEPGAPRPASEAAAPLPAAPQPAAPATSGPEGSTASGPSVTDDSKPQKAGAKG